MLSGGQIDCNGSLSFSTFIALGLATHGHGAMVHQQGRWVTLHILACKIESELAFKYFAP